MISSWAAFPIGLIGYLLLLLKTIFIGKYNLYTSQTILLSKNQLIVFSNPSDKLVYFNFFPDYDCNLLIFNNFYFAPTYFDSS